jgi:Dolichyl-phosphate-mannose-protein mannosyltransferase
MEKLAMPPGIAVPVSKAAVKSSSSPTNVGIVVTLLTVGIVARILAFVASRNTGGDALTRIALTAKWLQHPTLKVIFDSYPPGHFWLIGGLALLFHDVSFAGRLLSLLCGIGCLFLVWKLAVVLYGETAGIFSLAVICLYTMHIAYSTTSSSEISYLFFLLASLFWFFFYLRAEPRNIGYLILSGLCLSISESIRFEAWVFFCGMLVLLAFQAPLNTSRQEGVRRRFGPLFAFGIAGGIWPVFMMAYCYQKFGDPIYLVNWTHIRVQQLLATQPTPVGYQLSLMPGVLLISLSPLALAAGIYGLVKSFSLPLPRALASLALFFLSIQNYQLLKGATVAVARYTLTMGTLVAIFSGYGFGLFCRKLALDRIRLAMIGVVALLTANTLAVLAMSEVPNRYAEKFASVSPRLRYPTRIAGVGRYLRTHMGPKDAVVIDDYNEESNILADASGLPVMPGERAYLQSMKNPIDARQYIDAIHPRFLVYSDVGTLHSSFSLPKNCNREAGVGGVKFHCAFANHFYRVYELTYSESAGFPLPTPGPESTVEAQ